MGDLSISKALGLPAATTMEMQVQVGIHLTVTTLCADRILGYAGAVFYLMYQRMFLKGFYGPVQGGAF